MRKYFFNLGLCFLIHLSSSYAAPSGCGADVRLDAVGGSMEHVPPIDQKALPICYAFSAAELLQTWRCSHGAPDCQTAFVSPLAIATNAELGQLASSHRRGDESPVSNPTFWGYDRSLQLSSLFHGPYCNQTAMPSMDETSTVNAEINKLLLEYASNCGNRVGPPPPPPRPSFPGHPAPALIYQPSPPGTYSCRFMNVNTANQDMQSLNSCLLQNNFPANLDMVKNSLGSLDFFNLIYQDIKKDCDQNPISIPNIPRMDFYDVFPPGGTDLDPARMAAAQKAIDQVLDKGPKAQPIYAAYCLGMLSGGRSSNSSAKPEDCSGHASLIIGRRTDPNSPHACQYLIRNSWGQNCPRAGMKGFALSYSADWECDASKGDVWVDESVMLRNLSQVGGVEGDGIGNLIDPSYLNSQTQ